MLILLNGQKKSFIWQSSHQNHAFLVHSETERNIYQFLIKIKKSDERVSSQMKFLKKPLLRGFYKNNISALSFHQKLFKSKDDDLQSDLGWRRYSNSRRDGYQHFVNGMPFASSVNMGKVVMHLLICQKFKRLLQQSK